MGVEGFWFWVQVELPCARCEWDCECGTVCSLCTQQPTTDERKGMFQVVLSENQDQILVLTVSFVPIRFTAA